MEKTREFYAFISYKREDEKWAKWLQDKLEHYKFPTNLNGRTDLPKEIRPTFRDVTNLEPGLLEERIDAALHNSQWLIVVCSPRSAQSPWVCKEAQSFIDQGRANRIIPFVIEGTPFSNDIATECYPDALRSLTGSQELLAANINEMGRDAAVIKVVACMFGLRFDTLWQRHERQKRRRRNWIIAMVTLFLSIVLCIAAYIWKQNNELTRSKTELQLAYDNLAAANKKTKQERSRAEQERDRANQERLRAEQSEDSIRHQNRIIEQTNTKLHQTIDAKSIAQSKAAAKAAMELINEGDSYRAQRVALAALNLAYTTEAEKTLRQASQKNDAVLKGHRDGVSHIAYCPNGNNIVSSSYDRTIRIWDSNSGKCLRILEKHGSFVNSAMYSHDGTRIISSSSDSTIIIWNAESGEVLKTINTGTDNVYAAYNHKGDKFVYVTDKNAIYIYDLRTSEIVDVGFSSRFGKDKPIFSNDDNFLFTIDNKCIKMYNTNTGLLSKTFYGHTKEIQSVVLSVDGKQIISTAEDGTIRLWNIEDSECVSIIPRGESSFVYSATSSVSSGGDYFFIDGRKDSIIRVINLTTGEDILTITNNKGKIRSAAINFEKKQVVYSVDKDLIIINFFPMKNILSLKYAEQSNSVEFNHNSDFVVSTGPNSPPILWDLSSNDCRRFGKYVSEYAMFSPKGEIIASASGNYIYLFDVKNGDLLYRFDGHTDRIFSARFNLQGNMMVSASRDNTIRIWDLKKKTCIWKNEHGKSVLSARFSPCGKQIVSASVDSTVRIWDIALANCVTVLKGHKNSVNDAAFSPNGKYIVSGSSDNNIIIWDISTEAIKSTLRGHSGWVESVNYDSSGTMVISASWDNTVKIWDVFSGDCIFSLTLPDHVNYACFSPDNMHIAASCYNGEVWVFRFPPLQELISTASERFKNNPLTPEERKKYYLE